MSSSDPDSAIFMDDSQVRNEWTEGGLIVCFNKWKEREKGRQTMLTSELDSAIFMDELERERGTILV